MRTTTEAKWAERVSAWRASGLDAAAFATGRGYEASTLRWWASRLGRDETPAIVPVVARPSGSRGGRAEVTAHTHSAVVIEVGGARVRVTPGFDGALLAAVVRALSDEGAR